MKSYADVTRRLRHPYVLVAVAAAGVVLALLPGARSHRAPSGPQTLTIAGQGPRACAAPLVQARRTVTVVVSRRATAARTLQASATRSAVAPGAHGLARASATATDRVRVTQAASASARVRVLLRVGSRVRACARATTASAAASLALARARRAGRLRAQRELAVRATSARAMAQRRAGPGVLRSATRAALRGLAGRLVVAQRRVMAAATRQAQRDAVARAGRATV